MKQRNKNYSLRPGVDVGVISKLVGCKMLTRVLLKLKWSHQSLPTARGFKNDFQKSETL